MEKYQKFHELCFRIEELVKEYSSPLNVPGIYLDLIVWNEYVTVDFSYPEYIAFTRRCIHVSPDLIECKSRSGVERIYSVTRVRGGYRLEREC